MKLIENVKCLKSYGGYGKGKLFLIGLLFPIFSFSQDMPNVIPPSPQTQELNKYITFPVDHSTGIPEISIPLYTIRTNGLDIPISLNYHASGIKHGQDDGDVGVGWSLSCNYRVSRTIYGHPDAENIEMIPAFYQSKIQYFNDNLGFPIDFPINYDNRHLLYPFLDRDKFLSRFIASYYNGQRPVNGGVLLDGEYDQFNYSVPTSGGKFIISDRTSKTISEINRTRNKFDYLEGTASNNFTSGIIGFSIKDDNQNSYSFGEQVDKLGSKVLETNISALDLRNVTAWALTDIDTKFGEKIKFSYRNKTIGSKYKRYVGLDVIEPLPYTYLRWQHQIDNEAKNSNYSIFALKFIKTANERIEFVDSSTGGKIHQIDITDSLSNDLIKRIEFYYQSIDFGIHSYSVLDSVKIFDKDLIQFQKYSFDYYDANDYAPGTLDGDLVFDKWGFNKIVEAGPYRLLPNELANDHMRSEGSFFSTNRISGNLGQFYPAYLGNTAENLMPELLSLKTIKYPTGGFTVYEYEPNKYGEFQYLGGIRIKSISHFEKVDQNGFPVLNLKRGYSYSLGGRNGYPVGYEDFRKEHMVFHDSGGTVARRALAYSSNYFGDRTDAENAVYYPQVTETTTSNNGHNGKITYQYDNTYSSAQLHPFFVDINDANGMFSYYQGGPTYISTYHHWRKPVLISKKIYSKENKLMKKESYNYFEVNRQSFTGLKVRPFANVNNSFNEDYPVYYVYVSSIFNHGLYTIETGKSLLAEKQETVFSDSESISITTSYQYNNLDQVVKQETVDSKGHVIETHTKYPKDSPFEQISMRLLQANDVNKVLEQSVQRNNVLVSQIKNEFLELPGEIFVPNKITRYNTDSQMLEDGIVFHKYDDKANVQSLSKANDVVVNYLWSYNGRYPIAEIKGPSYQVIENALGAAAIVEFSSRPNPNKDEIDALLAPLRNAIASRVIQDTEMISMSYDHLLGIKSQTDSRGKSLYYEYDSSGRLKVIKDDSGFIQKTADYHYRNH